MKNLKTESLVGTRVTFTSADLHHRVDETHVGLRVVTAFIEGHILWCIPEAELRALLTLSVMKKSQQSDADYNVNASWVYSLDALLRQVIPGKQMNARSRSAWERLDAATRETHSIHIQLVAVTAFSEYMNAKHFAAVGNPLTGNYDVDAHAALLGLKFVHPVSVDDPLFRWR